ncbi:MAG TPA: hypothetical protein VK909_21165 [Anaerolineales bacterium]|nr:hypothetical protein [Anaerolineales bacterium]
MATNKKNNNKRYRKQKQRTNFPWLFVALGGGLLLLAAVLFANRAGDDGGIAALSVDQTKIDYGYVKFGENRQFTLTVTNEGEGTLKFKEKPYIEVLEGC